jgi:hypothetical protein
LHTLQTNPTIWSLHTLQQTQQLSLYTL